MHVTFRSQPDNTAAKLEAVVEKPADITEDTKKATDEADEPVEAAEEPTTDTQEESEEDEPSSSRASSSAPSTPTAAASRSATLKAVDPPEPVKTPTPLSPRAEPFAPAPKLEDLLAQAEQAKGKEAAHAPAGDKGKQSQASASPQKAPPVTPKPQKHANISLSKGVHSIAAKVEAAVKTGASVIPTVLQVSDMHWFTSDADLMEAAATAGVEVTFKDITFLEHKCNGKSKG